MRTPLVVSRLVPTSLLGLVLTMVDRRTRSAREISEMIRDHYQGLVFESEVRINVRLAEAPSFGKSIQQYSPSCVGARCYMSLAEEVLRRLKRNRKRMTG